VREHRELDIARQEKQEWVQRATELLNCLFNHSGAADQFNDWVGTILPEYAEFSMFVDQFDEEMRHRLDRLRAIIKSMRDLPEPVISKGPPMSSDLAVTEVITSASAANPEMDAPFAAQAMQAQAAQASLRSVAVAPAASKSPTQRAAAGKSGLLIVRASDSAACDAVAKFIEHLGLSLHVSDRAAANGTPLVDELSEMQSSSSGFALVFTAPPEQSQQTDADALFDLGCCVGKLGAERVIVLHRGSEPHVDRFGLSHIVFDSFDGWQLQLARHLRRGGVEVDLNKLI
jgi:predicted nucleotide-binding protein